MTLEKELQGENWEEPLSSNHWYGESIHKVLFIDRMTLRFVSPGLGGFRAGN